MSEHFKIFAEAFIKSGTPKKNEPIKIGGIISTEDVDADGETVLTKGLDLSYFSGGFGKIKYEHDSEISHEPHNIIGFPTKIIKGANKIEFEGDLVSFDPEQPDSKLSPQQRLAKSAYGLLKSVEEHNRRYPKSPQKVGYSIEGEYLDRSKSTGLVKKARVTNVVLTTKPKNMKTVAMLVKSMGVGYGTSPETQTGFGATRLESVDKSSKSQISNIGEKEMTFKSEEEAYKYFLTQGMSEEEARAKAKSEFSAGGLSEDAQNAMKSLQAVGSKMQKSLGEIEDCLNIGIEGTDVGQKLLKSIETLKNSDQPDLSEYMEEKTNADLQIHENIIKLNTKVDGMLKALATVAEGMSEIASGNVALIKSIDLGDQRGKLLARGLHKLLTGHDMKKGLVSDKLLDSINYVENNEVVEDFEKLEKSRQVEVLDKMVDDGKITPEVVIAFEGTGYLPENVKAMVKSFTKQTMKK